MSLNGKTILITGGAKRLGKNFVLTAARAGADVVIHHGHSPFEAAQLAAEVNAMGRRAWVVEGDLNDPYAAIQTVIDANQYSPLYGLVNNAALFEMINWQEVTPENWQEHLNINLAAPFFLSQAFFNQLGKREGRIVNILDWRAFRPGIDHVPYTVSKAGLASLTQILAQAFSPRVTVNGLALGAILPPANGAVSEKIIESVPAKRWATLEEVGQALLFLLDGPSYITGEIIHVDGGRHLV